jgi:metal-responsive CopG/Arc/MetJ family transcriptional regulator
MTRKPVLVQLSDELIEKLDRLGETQARSRSALVRDAVERYVAEESEDLLDRRMAEAYRAVPDDADFAAWADHAQRELVEEEPW